MRAVTVPEWAERVFLLTVTPTRGSMAPFEMVAFGGGKRGVFRATLRKRIGDLFPLQTVTTPEVAFRPGSWRVLNDLLDRAGFWVWPTVSPFDTSNVRDGTVFALTITESNREHLVVRHADVEQGLSRVVNYLVDASGVFGAGTSAGIHYRHDGQPPEGASPAEPIEAPARDIDNQLW